MKNDNNFFEVKNLSKQFKNKTGVEDICFSLNKGDIVGFLGDNGTGKTTTIKLIFNELIKNSGELLLDGQPMNGKNNLEKIAFFPDQNNYPKDFNIIEFALYSADLKNIEKKDVEKNLEIFIEALSLDQFRKNTFNELSAGMQKRALLLSILVTNPEIIILDEPTANLDVKSRLDFLKILSHLSKNFKKSIIITSHNIDELSNLINRVVIIKKDGDKGKVVYNNIFDNTVHDIREIYIEKIGGLSTNINFEKISEVNFNDNVSTKNSKKIRFPVFNRTIFSMLKSKLFITMTALFMFLYIATIIGFSFFKAPLYFDLITSMLSWLPFSILLIYISYFEIHFTSKFYCKEIKGGVFNLEIRSGLNKNRIFWERFFANKVIIFSFILVAITVFAFFIPLLPNFYSRTTVKAVLPGYFILIVLDLLLFSIISLFFTFNFVSLVGVIGTLFAFGGAMAMPSNYLMAYLVYSDQATYNLNESAATTKLYNTRLLIGSEMENIMKKYGENSILRQHITSLDGLYELLGLDFQTYFYTEYDKIMGWTHEEALISPETYFKLLIVNGMLTEFENLNIYSSNGQISFNVTEEFKNNDLVKFMHSISDLQSKSENDNLKLSLFNEYDWNEAANNKVYQNDNGLNKLIKEIKSKNKNNNELIEIAQLVQKISLYAYDRYNLDKNFKLTVLEPPLDFWFRYSRPMWTYGKNDSLNKIWNDKVKISDGARTFNKIYGDLLLSYVNLKQPIYGVKYVNNQQEPMFAREYTEFTRTVSYLNPFITFTRIVYESSLDKYHNALYTTSEWVDTTYELVNYSDSKERNDYAPNFDSIKKFGNTFSPALATLMYLGIVAIILGSGYLIYIKKIIK